MKHGVKKSPTLVHVQVIQKQKWAAPDHHHFLSEA
jgi:hypothetical protein